MHKKRPLETAMKPAALTLLLFPIMSWASWSLPGLPEFTDQGSGLFVSKGELPKGALPLRFDSDGTCWQPAGAVKLNQMLAHAMPG